MLNNKGFAISSIMYLILVMIIVVITGALAILSSRKLILDNIKKESLKEIYSSYDLSYRDTISELKTLAINYATANGIEHSSIKISTLNDLTNTIDDEVLDGYNLSDKYLTISSNGLSYDIYLGKYQI